MRLEQHQRGRCTWPGRHFGVFIAERVRFLWLKSPPADFRLPADREPTEEEQRLWPRALSDHVRAIGTARANADLALLVGVAPLFGALIYAAVHQRPTRTDKGTDTNG
jgi:hypothetical protein